MKLRFLQGNTSVSCGESYGFQKNTGIYALAQAMNELSALGVDPVDIALAKIRILTPANRERARTWVLSKPMEKALQSFGAGVTPEVSGGIHSAVNQYYVHVTLAGTATGTAGEGDAAIAPGPGTENSIAEDGAAGNRAALDETAAAPKPGDSIVMCGYAGLEGMLRIADEKTETLEARFAPTFIHQIKSLLPCIYQMEAARMYLAGNPSYIYPCGEGGIFAALHYMAEELKTGIEIDLRSVLLKQETVEVCELFRLNPYQLMSTGCMLMVTEDPEGLLETFSKAEIPAAVIGFVREDHDKIIRNGEEMRYIDRPVPDELMKIFPSQR